MGSVIEFLIFLFSETEIVLEAPFISFVCFFIALGLYPFAVDRMHKKEVKYLKNDIEFYEGWVQAVKERNELMNKRSSHDA